MIWLLTLVFTLNTPHSPVAFDSKSKCEAVLYQINAKYPKMKHMLTCTTGV